nr:3-hydroxyacyl-CoA dehydrogenase NAD-binding domain-containing protein [Streptomyces antimycoticus]
MARPRLTTGREDFADRDLVIEAVAERKEVKTSAFATLDKAVRRPAAILASNTSSIPLMRLGTATNRPAHVIGFHAYHRSK